MGKKSRKHKKAPTKLEFVDGTVLYDREWDLKFAEGPVLYDHESDPSRIDGETMEIINKCIAFALQVHNDTHKVKFSLERLLLATGDLSMVDLKFTAKNEPIDGLAINLKIFRARVSFTREYVEFVEFLPAYLLTPDLQGNASTADYCLQQPPGPDKL